MAHINRALPELMPMQLCPEFNHNVRAIVIDSHRPVWHGYNINADTDVLIVVDDDDPVPAQDIPPWVDEQSEDEEEEQAGVWASSMVPEAYAAPICCLVELSCVLLHHLPRSHVCSVEGLLSAPFS